MKHPRADLEIARTLLPFERRWPELARAAERISNEAYRAICEAARATEEPDCPYKGQAILERVAYLLERRI